MELDTIKILLKQAIGLDASSIGAAAIERAVRQRAAVCGLSDWRDYPGHVCSSNEELKELIEAVVVSETWFFRDHAAFTSLARLAQTPRFSSRWPLRLLSVPCSTGEEPYSMAMALLDAGLAPEQFCIEAVDISASALAQARRAVYGNNSFRGAAHEICGHHFAPVNDGHRLHPDVQRLVTFAQGNLLSEASFAGRERWDFIFCRNVFIYLDAPAQEQVLRLLHGVLRAQGVLFVGPAESPLIGRHSFVSARLPGAFAFRKTTANKLRPLPFSPAPSRSSQSSQCELALKPELPRRVAEPGDTFAARLELARQLANRAQLQEAVNLCEVLLVEQAESAEALCLLALLRDAEGELESAHELYRKVLYLDPNHAEALAHLALLNEKFGDGESARLLHRRAHRVHRKLQP